MTTGQSTTASPLSEYRKLIGTLVATALIAYATSWFQSRDQLVRQQTIVEQMQAQLLEASTQKEAATRQRQELAVQLAQQAVTIQSLTDQIRRIEKEQDDMRNGRR